MAQFTLPEPVEYKGNEIIMQPESAVCMQSLHGLDRDIFCNAKNNLPALYAVVCAPCNISVLTAWLAIGPGSPGCTEFGEAKCNQKIVNEGYIPAINQAVYLRWHAPLYFQPGIQGDRILCLCELLAESLFWESSTGHCP